VPALVPALDVVVQLLRLVGIMGTPPQAERRLLCQ